MTTGQKIYELRKSARITQEQFAEKLEVSRQAVSKWESDAAYPETDKIIKIAELFGVSCDYLLKDGAEAENGVLSKRRRALFSMFVAFALACAIVGYIVAIICYYCINMHESSLIGLGVLAAFLLAAFILWQVGRYRFLNECDYSETDKAHLAKMAKAWYYASIITLFCYLPTLALYNLQGVINISIDTGHGTVEQSIVAYRYMNWYEFMLTLVTFASAGIACARACELFHLYSLGNMPQKTDIADRIILFAVLAATAGCTVASIILSTTESYTYDYLYFTGNVLVGIYPAAILARLIVHKVYNKVPKPIFVLHIVCCVLFALTAGFGNSGMYVVAYFTGAVLVVAAIVLIVFSALQAKYGRAAFLSLLGTSLPVYVFSGILLILEATGIYEFIALAACLASTAVALALSVAIPVNSKAK